jgi:hypothetical protein
MVEMRDKIWGNENKRKPTRIQVETVMHTSRRLPQQKRKRKDKRDKERKPKDQQATTTKHVVLSHHGDSEA